MHLIMLSAKWQIFCLTKWQLFCLDLNVLSPNVQGPNFSSSTKSIIIWLLMPWLLLSPGHQRPWYWLRRIGKFLSYMRKDFKYLCHVSVEEWNINRRYIIMFPMNNLAYKVTLRYPNQVSIVWPTQPTHCTGYIQQSWKTTKATSNKSHFTDVVKMSFHLNLTVQGPGGHFKNIYKLVNLRALKFLMIMIKNRLFQCVGKMFCVEFQRFPLKFHIKCLTHTLKDT